MKTILRICKPALLLAAIALCGSLPYSCKTTDDATVVGTVSCEGRPVAGAVVSDGIEVVQTDRKGRYRMNSQKKDGYVFISVPSGYRVGSDGPIPRHFVRLAGEVVDTADFELYPMDSDDYTLFVMTDVHLTGSDVDRDLEQFHATLFPDICAEAGATPGEVFTFSLGDMTTDAKWYVTGFALPEYLETFRDYPTPIYHIMGNHDNERKIEGPEEDWDAWGEATYKKVIGPNYYSMNIGQVHYIMLDNIVTGGTMKNKPTAYIFDYMIDDAQLAWIEKDLAYVDSSTPVVVCMHVPGFRHKGLDGGKPVISRGISDKQDVEVLTSMLARFDDVHILSGHVHQTRNVVVSENLMEHTLVSASAVSWKINDEGSRLIAGDGSPAGYQIFKVRGKDISWRFKGNNVPVAESQMRIYDLNTVPAKYGGTPGANEVLVNVFNWDPQWTVSVSENGRPLPVEQVWTTDPLYDYIRTNTTVFPTRPTAFLVDESLHFFKAKASVPGSEISVEVTDRFGTKYTARAARPKPFSWDME